MTSIDWNQKADLAATILRSIEKYGLPFEEGVIPNDPVSQHSHVNRLYYAKTAILTHDENGILNFYNGATIDVFGFQPEEAIGQPSKELLVPKDGSLINEREAELERVLKEMIKVEVPRTKRNHKEGYLVDIHAWVSPYEVNPGKFSHCAIVRRLESIATST